MLTPEQKEMWRRLDSLTSGLADLLQWNAADGNGVTSEDADRASCYLAIVGEVRPAILWEKCAPPCSNCALRKKCMT